MSAKDPLARLVNELSKLPGIGEKTAARLAFYILKAPKSYAQNLSAAVLEVTDEIRLCGICANLSKEKLCHICSDTGRDASSICVVEEPGDLMAIEKTNAFRGKYHVLHGVISPLEGIGPQQLKIRELLERLQKEPVKEIILATNTSVEGEATSLYLVKLLKDYALSLTRLAHGIPMGGDLEYIDTVTIGNAIQNRVALNVIY